MLVDLTTLEISDNVLDEKNLGDFKLPVALRATLKEHLGSRGYDFDCYTSFASVKSSGNFAVIPNQYFYYAFKLSEFARELNKYFVILDRIRPDASWIGESTEIISNIAKSQPLSKNFGSNGDVDLFALFFDTNNSSHRFDGRNPKDGSGLRGSRELFSSIILKVTNMPQASATCFGDLVYDLCQSEILYEHLCTAISDILIGRTNEVVSLRLPGTTIELYKPFILLAGISGTGKTRFVRNQAKATGTLSLSYLLTPVRPDWHEPGDLLGYQSRLSGSVEYVVTDILRFICKAWCAIKDAGVSIEAVADGMSGVTCSVTGSSEKLAVIKPYWLCLDEMNLAPVELYFSDYLSVLETRVWQWEDSQFTYSCDPLLASSMITDLDEQGRQAFRTSVGLESLEYDELWNVMCKNGISIPFNLIVAGTVNMDETTHGFSRKVIDRALSIDFGEFYPNNYDEFFNPTTENVVFTYPNYTSGGDISSVAPAADPDGKLSVNFLTAVNAPLRGTSFELAYRALNELLLAVMVHKPVDEITLQAVWDDFIVTKVLPRIEGDEAKLALQNPDEYSDDVNDVLAALQEVLQVQLTEIWSTSSEKPSEENLNSRPDLHRVSSPSLAVEAVSSLKIPCRSRAKLSWMQQKLQKSTFTSFWP